ncbi:MAG: hypothetical protein QM723_20985 [Myxococcaceae bacterium]
MLVPVVALAASLMGQYELGNQGETRTKLVVKVGQDPADDAAEVAIHVTEFGVPSNDSVQAMWFHTGAVTGLGIVDAVIVDELTYVPIASGTLQLQANSWVRWAFPAPVLTMRPVNRAKHVVVGGVGQVIEFECRARLRVQVEQSRCVHRLRRADRRR